MTNSINTTAANTPEEIKAEALSFAKHLNNTTAAAVRTALNIGDAKALGALSTTVNHYLDEAARILNDVCAGLGTTVTDLMADDREFFEALDLDIVDGVYSGGLLDYSTGRAFVDCLDLGLGGIGITAAPHPTGAFTASACAPSGVYIAASKERFFISFMSLEDYIQARYGLELVTSARDLFEEGENSGVRVFEFYGM